MLKTVVCIRFCVDVAQLRVDSATGAPRSEGVPWRVSTLDEHAIESAVQLKERHGGSIKALSLVRAEPPKELVLKVLAMGVDEMHLVLDPTAEQGDALATATVLSAALTGQPLPDLVLFGEGSIDRFEQQVGPRVAEQLGLPSVTYASRLTVAGGVLQADRILEDRVETVRCAFPAVVTVGHESPTPRMPSVLQILGAARKPTVVRPIAEIGLLRSATCATLSGVQTLAVTAPRTERKQIKLPGDSPDEAAIRLVRALLSEGIIKS